MRTPTLRGRYIIEPENGKIASTLCGLILAGTDEQHDIRSRGLAPEIMAQRVELMDPRSALERTYCRAESLIPPQRLFTLADPVSIVRPEIQHQLLARPSSTVILAPQEKGSGLALLIAVAHINCRYRETSIALFPAENSSCQEDRVMRYVHLAYVIVRRHPSKIVLLGSSLAEPVSSHGHIIPSSHRDITGWGTQAISQIVEPNDRLDPYKLAQLGAFGNTRLMVFNSDFLLRCVEALQPRLTAELDEIRAAVDTPAETSQLAEAFKNLDPINFTADLLQPIAEMCPGRLLVLPMTGVARRWYTEAALARTPVIRPVAQHSSWRYARRSRERGPSKGKPHSILQ
jgi:mannose-1-phosphate guanylyltransferase